MEVIAASLWRLNHYAIRLRDAINDSVLVGGFKVAIELLHERVVMLLVGKAHVTPQLPFTICRSFVIARLAPCFGHARLHTQHSRPQLACDSLLAFPPLPPGPHLEFAVEVGK